MHVHVCMSAGRWVKVCVCVCLREREREKGVAAAHINDISLAAHTRISFSIYTHTPPLDLHIITNTPFLDEYICYVLHNLIMREMP